MLRLFFMSRYYTYKNIWSYHYIMMENVSKRFWNDAFWLPEGSSFDDLVSTSDAVYAQRNDLYALPVYGLVVFILRHIFEKCISNKIARRILTKDFKNVENNGCLKKNKPITNGSNGVTQNGVTAHSSSAEKIRDRKQRKELHLENTLAKIAETGWKSLYHSFSFSFGMILLLQAPWFWDNRQCWIGFPKHELWPSLYYYYMIEGAYYIALVMCLATDVKRKDRGMMTIHHIATINLIVFSYATNQTRIGSLLMVLHRLADMLLQIAKLLLYCKRKSIANAMFMIFVLVFVVTRLYIYPFYVVHTSFVKLTWYHRPYPWYYIGNAIAFGLQVLHILWAHIILKMAFKVVTNGPLDKDDRSEVETSEKEKKTK